MLMNVDLHSKLAVPKVLKSTSCSRWKAEKLMKYFDSKPLITKTLYLRQSHVSFKRRLSFLFFCTNSNVMPKMAVPEVSKSFESTCQCQDDTFQSLNLKSLTSWLLKFIIFNISMIKMIINDGP